MLTTDYLYVNTYVLFYGKVYNVSYSPAKKNSENSCSLHIPSLRRNSNVQGTYFFVPKVQSIILSIQ